MKIKELFKEEYNDTFNAFINGKKVIINIFKNPKKSEMEAVSENGAIKFLQSGKDLYVFSPLAYHYNIIRYLKLNLKDGFPQGVANFKKGKWVADPLDKSYKTLKNWSSSKIEKPD